MRVFVLLFNARTDNEGIHTLKVGDRNIVLMFENEDDAARFGLMLEAQDFPNSSVEIFDSADIEEFCQGAGYECKQVPEGTLAVPPETNLEKTDWDPETKPDEVAKADAATESESAMSEEELNRIRRQLEGLL